MSNPRLLTGTLSYKGTSYFGFQKTKMGPSIQETLEKALATVLRHPVKVEGVSRTDRGVHARGQVVFFCVEGCVDLSRLKRSLNQITPPDITLHTLHFGEASQLLSKKKEYRYSICNTSVQSPFHRETSWHFFKPLALDLMRQGALSLLGTHDFSALTNLSYEDPIRTVESIEVCALENGRIEIRIIGDRFLYKMARNIVGTLVYVGCGKIAADEVGAILQSKKRSLAGITAPAHGLCLHRILLED